MTAIDFDPAPSVPDQRWVRPLDVEPGHWKKQLPTKHLRLGAIGDLKALQDMLAEHPDFLNRRGSHNRTLLWEAARKGRLPAVQWLAEQGANVNATGAYNSESHVQITPYVAAVYYRHPEVAEFLRSRGAEEDTFRAAFLGDLDRVRHDLDADPSLLFAEDPHDLIYHIPLVSFAVAGGQAETTRWLLRRGASVAPYSAQLIFLAARASRRDLIDLLMAHGVDLRAVDVGIVTATPDPALLRYLLDLGLPVATTGKNGFPPLVFAARGDKGERLETVKLLLDYGAPINATESGGKTALHYAAAAGHTRLVALLLARGADPSLRDSRGNTALSLARAAGRTDVIALLQ